MELRYTILYVADVRKSLEFYRDAFGFEISFLHEGEDDVVKVFDTPQLSNLPDLQ